MATGEIHVELAVNYADDPKMAALARWPRDARGARDLYVQMVCYAKDNMTDGRVPVEIVGRLVYPDSVKVGQRQAGHLAEVGLIQEDGDYWIIPAYLKRNKSRAEVEEASEKLRRTGSESGSYGNHLRWHVNQGRTDPECKHCRVNPIDPVGSTRSGGDRGAIAHSQRHSQRQKVDRDSVGSSPKPPREEEHRAEDEPRSKPIGIKAAILSREYTDRVTLSDRAKVAGVVMAAIEGGYDDATIKRGLRGLAKESRPVTPDTLRIAIEGKTSQQPKSAYTPPRDGRRGREGW